MILPGSSIGILGGGQLGRMLAQAAMRMGYAVHIYEPVGPCPAGEVATSETNAPYEDLEALRSFAGRCDVVTYEFENVPAAPLRAIEGLTRLHPHWRVLETCQNRWREKAWLRDNGSPHARFAQVVAGSDVAVALREIGAPCVIKTADFGYDGKGQMNVRTEDDMPAAAAAFAGRACIVEQWIDFACEVSVIVARSDSAAVRVFPVAENIHTNHILDFSIVPARVPAPVAAEAERLARLIAERIGLVGVMGVEMFVTRDGNVLVNELAPRTHNSGHWTIDACVTSQFEQQVRAVCGLPLGDVTLVSPVVMVNILGDAWSRGEPRWADLLATESARLHLYGKKEPRPGRKMGHFTVTARDAESALSLARQCKARL